MNQINTAEKLETQVETDTEKSHVKHDPRVKKFRWLIKQGLECRKYALESLKTNGNNGIIDGDIQVLYNLANNLYKAASMFPQYEEFDRAILYLGTAKEQLNTIRNNQHKMGNTQFLIRCHNLDYMVSQAKNYMKELKEDKEGVSQAVNYGGHDYNISFSKEMLEDMQKKSEDTQKVEENKDIGTKEVYTKQVYKSISPNELNH